MGWEYERLLLWSTKVCRGDEWPAGSQFWRNLSLVLWALGSPSAKPKPHVTA